MKNRAVPALQSQSVPDRAVLRAKLEATRSAFHRQLVAVADKQWHQKSASSAWTMGEVLVHLTWALEYLPKEVEMARQGKGMFNMPAWLANPGSYWMIRWQARKSDPVSLQRRYDAAMDRVIAAIETVPDSDWRLGARFYGHGFYTVADLFETPGQHLTEHTGQRLQYEAGEGPLAEK
jgi:hypothetical protein